MLERIKNIKFQDIVQTCFDKTYLADGVDIFMLSDPDNTPDWLTRLSSFIGLPNRILDKKAGQSAMNLAMNFIGYQRNVSRLKTTINFALMPLTILLNLITLPMKFLLNLAKLATEFLPGLAQELCINMSQQCISYAISPDINAPRRIAAIFSGLVAGIVSLAFGQIYNIGRAITSPISAVKDAWQKGNKTGGVTGKIIGGLLAGISITITFTAYAILLPLALKAIAVPVLNFTATHVSTALANFVQTGINVITPALTTVGEAFIPAVNWIASAFTFNAVDFAPVTSALSSAAIGLSGLASIALTTIGTAISTQINRFKNWWHQPETPANIQPVSTNSASQSENSNLAINSYLQKNQNNLSNTMPATINTPAQTNATKPETDLSKLGTSLSLFASNPEQSKNIAIEIKADSQNHTPSI